MVQSVDAFLLFIYLLPGFVGMLVFESLAEIKKREYPEKVGLVIIFSILSMSFVNLFYKIQLIPNFDEIKKDPGVLSNLITSNVFYGALSSILIGIIFAYLANKNILYHIAVKCGITRRTGAIDPWHQVFGKYRRVWIQIRFDDGSILVGWPKYYSETGESREVFIAEATWHFPYGTDCESNSNPMPRRYNEVDVYGEGVLISNFSKIRAIELLDGENNDGQATKNT